MSFRILFPALFLVRLAAFGQSSPPEFHFTSVEENVLEQSNQLDAKLEKQGLVYRDPEAEAYLARIGVRLLGDSPAPEHVNFRFQILRDPMVNAFALPNGSVYVNTGLIAAVHNEAQMASVLAHEITHVTARHAYLENRSVRRKNVALDVVEAAGAIAGFRAGAAYGGAIWAAVAVDQVFIVASVYGYTRDLERDADRNGYALLVHARYDGRAMTDALEILDERIEYEPIEHFWRTHPKLQERIATSKELALKNNADHQREIGDGDYLEHFAPVIRYNIRLDLESRRARTAVERAQRLVSWAPDDVRNVLLLADGYSALGAKTPKPQPEELAGARKKEDRNLLLKHTAEEEQQVLEARPDGPRVLAENRSEAEMLYKQAIGLTPQLGDPHRGLGTVYEAESRYAEAAAEYREYLELAPAGTVDRLRIQRRQERVQSKTGIK